MRKGDEQWEGRTGVLYVLSATKQLEVRGAAAGPTPPAFLYATNQETRAMLLLAQGSSILVP